MKERGILFSAPMVRAILAGTKTQTRRLLVPKTPWSAPGHERFAGMGNVVDGYAYALFKTPWEKVVEGWKTKPPVDWTHETRPVRCPYGAPGDRLWCRETWAPTTTADGRYAAIAFRAGGPLSCVGDAWAPVSKWKPGIHLRRVNARIVLDVLSVRVERLHDISEEDARAEGVTPAEVGDVSCFRAFVDLGKSINGAGSWAANPWVWVVSFSRVTP